MKFRDTLKMASISLIRRKFRTFLTSFAVFIGVFIIIFLVSLSFGAQKILLSQITNQFDIKSIFVIKKGALNLSLLTASATKEETEQPKSLDVDALNKISQIDGVNFATPILSFPSRKFEFKDKSIDDRVVESTRGAGWDLRADDEVYGNVLAGVVENIKNDEVVVTSAISDAYNVQPQNLIGKTIVLTDQPGFFGSQSKPLPPKEYKIVGVIDTIRDFTYILNLDVAKTDLAIRNGYENVDEFLKTSGFQTIYVKTNSEQSVKSISEEIRSLGFDATTLEEVLTIFNTFFNIIPIIFTLIGAIAIFVASIGIINTMVMSVFERTKEIGVMKAVGGKNRDILMLFVTEAGLIGFIGGLLAVVISLVLMGLLQSLFINNIFPELGITNISEVFITPLWLIVVSLVFSILVGVMAGYFPARRAGRLNPVDALRHE